MIVALFGLLMPRFIMVLLWLFSDYLSEAYGTWVEKSMYGRKYMGIDRATFLIDEKGVIRAIWRKVKVPGHAEDVLKAAAALK